MNNRAKAVLTAVVVLVVVAALAAVVAATAAASGTPKELPRSAFLTPSGHIVKLAAATYKASDFPLPLRLTTPDASWFGAQWKADSSFQHKKSTVPPYYGWVTFFTGDPNTGAGGGITIMTPYAATPSVAATVARLRTGGHGATYQASSPVKLAGYSGVQFDGQVVGKEHAFIPFTPKSNVGMWHPDASWAGPEDFRIIVLGVRGKTVVVYVENSKSAPDPFPAFLTKADTILNTVKFPG